MIAPCPTCKVEGNIIGPVSLWRCEDHGFYMVEGFENPPLIEALNKEYDKYIEGITYGYL